MGFCHETKVVDCLVIANLQAAKIKCMKEGVKTIKSALISVFNKEGLQPLIRQLHADGVVLYSTGGTAKLISDMGIAVNLVEDLTGFPEILGGRVKTLHPKVFGGILARRERGDDLQTLEHHAIPEIDMVVVNLYPFSETVKGGGTHSEIIEKIDIGGVALIRAAAKNFEHVTICAEPHHYHLLKDHFAQNGPQIDLEMRRRLAAEAFAVTAQYDSSIANYLAPDADHVIPEVGSEVMPLRYGENPHQQGVFRGDWDSLFKQHNGKAISYNNLLDIDAAVQLIAEFSETAVAILKHNNACGLASGHSGLEAFERALAADPVSAFGGIIASNASIDLPMAEAIHKVFCEVVIAPSYEPAALELLSSKKNRIILEQKGAERPTWVWRTVLNGVLGQERDGHTDSVEDLQTVTSKSPSEREISDLLFASKICKHTKSNTIVLVKDGQLLASGTGQTSRVDALRQAIAKAKSFQFNLEGAVMASDAFFPFPDCVEIANFEKIGAVIQPGGSIKDGDSIEYCNAHGMAMVFTGFRHFKH